MRPPPWRPPVDPSLAEQRIIRLIKRAKLFVFLRQALGVIARQQGRGLTELAVWFGTAPTTS